MGVSRGKRSELGTVEGSEDPISPPAGMLGEEYPNESFWLSEAYGFP